VSSTLVICDLYSRTHADILGAAAQITDEELHRTFGPRAPSTGFHAWHVARWADRAYESLSLTLEPGKAAEVVQVWDEYNLAEKWGLVGFNLGRYGTGMEMSDEDAARLVLREKSELLDYVSMAFAGVDKLVESLSQEALAMKRNRTRSDENGREMTVAEFLGSYVRHDNRHLGMIEALRGVMGLRGTATR
jgi:uncharacterized damage-inducible protein DinB